MRQPTTSGPQTLAISQQPRIWCLLTDSRRDHGIGGSLTVPRQETDDAPLYHRDQDGIWPAGDV
jgi:hypothetical protein